MLGAEPVAPDSPRVDERYIALVPVDGNPLPEASEQYVRGGRYFINYPQGDGRYAIRLALEPIESDERFIVLEATISIQTNLLDSHPMLDLVAEGNQVESYDQAIEGDVASWSSTAHSKSTGAPSITLVRGDSASTAVLLGPHDGPFTSDRSNEHRLCLRLFGDFLEKGVIRTARPWFVVNRSGEPVEAGRLQPWHDRLCKSPVPLSS